MQKRGSMDIMLLFVTIVLIHYVNIPRTLCRMTQNFSMHKLNVCVLLVCDRQPSSKQRNAHAQQSSIHTRTQEHMELHLHQNFDTWPKGLAYRADLWNSKYVSHVYKVTIAVDMSG